MLSQSVRSFPVLPVNYTIFPLTLSIEILDVQTSSRVPQQLIAFFSDFHFLMRSNQRSKQLFTLILWHY